MPYDNIEEAKKAKFPTKIDGATLTIAQVNQLANVYDAIKASESAKDPMAVAISKFKESHKKSDGSWVSAELFGAEVGADSYDPITHTVKAIKIGTVAHTLEGTPFECSSSWLEGHAIDWEGGSLIANHNGTGSEKFGDIVRSWWEDPFVMMEVGNMNPEAERRMLSDEHTGFSFDAIGYPDDPDNVFGTNLSILFYPHYPACPATEGCGLAADNTESNSQDVKNEVISKQIGSEAMVDREYTSAEIDSMKAEAATTAEALATLKAEAKAHDDSVAALKAEIAERTDKISELNEEKSALFSAEDVETKISDAKGDMFSAEELEAAKTKAVEDAIVAEKEKTELIAAELDAVNKMFPDGLDTEFRESVVAMVTEGKLHDVILKLGDIEYKELKANIPSGSVESGEDAEDIVAGVGTYDPRTKEWV